MGKKSKLPTYSAPQVTSEKIIKAKVDWTRKDPLDTRQQKEIIILFTLHKGNFQITCSYNKILIIWICRTFEEYGEILCEDQITEYSFIYFSILFTILIGSRLFSSSPTDEIVSIQRAVHTLFNLLSLYTHFWKTDYSLNILFNNNSHNCHLMTHNVSSAGCFHNSLNLI